MAAYYLASLLVTASRYWAARDASVGYNNVCEWFLFLSFDDLRSLLGFVKRAASVVVLAPHTSRRVVGQWNGAGGAICEDHV